MASETLQEFIVRVRYSQDSTEQNNMLGGIASVTGSVMKLGAAILATGAAVAYGTKKYAFAFNDLSQAASRMKMGVSDLKSMTAAASELGSSVESMKGSMESFASFQRRNPWGSVDFMRSMGADVELKDSNDVKLKKLSEAMQSRNESMGETAGTQLNLLQGQNLGIAENDLLAMMKPGWSGLVAKHNEAQKTNNYDETAQIANKAVIALDDADLHVDAAKSKLMVPALEAGTKAVDKFSEHIDSVTGKLSDLEDALSIPDWMKKLQGNPGDPPPTTGGMMEAAGTVAGSFFSGVGNAMSEAFGNPVEARKKQALESFKAHGATAQEASGAVANLMAESSLNPNAIGDGGKAYGIMQWHKDRQMRYAEKYGHTMQDAAKEVKLSEQLDFYEWEKIDKGGDQISGWDRAKSSGKSAREYGEAISRNVVRPGLTPEAKDREATNRGQDADRISHSSLVMNVYGVSDAHKVVALMEEKGAKVSQMNSRNQAAGTR